MKKYGISSRGIILVDENNNSYPIFVGDPRTTIHITYSNKVKKLNQQIQNSMKYELDNYIMRLSLLSRIRANMFLIRYWRYKFFYFIKDEGITAFHPAIPLLDYILKFCIKFNCLEILSKCLEIVDTEIFTKTSIHKINPDMLYSIMYSKDKSNLHFIWTPGKVDWIIDMVNE